MRDKAGLSGWLGDSKTPAEGVLNASAIGQMIQEN